MGHAPSTRTPLPAAILALAFVGALSGAPAGAQVVINEIYPNPPGTADATDERVEIYNAGTTAVNMTGWAIEDLASIDDPTIRGRIPEDFDTAACGAQSVIIQPGEFRVIKLIDGSGVLNNGGDDVYIVSDRTTNTVVHTVHYPCANPFSPCFGPPEGYVWACIPNGTSSFDWRDTRTLCASNGGPVGDVTAPATVSDLVATPGLWPGEIRLTWTAPGDDGATGTASAYIIKVAYNPINAGNFSAAADLDRWGTEPVPSAGATPETLLVFGFDPDSTYYFALQTTDEVPNTSAVSNSPGTLPAIGGLLDSDLGYSAYFGNLHSHSSYSDGVLTPADAYDFARNLANTPLDFLAVTDHNHVSAGMQLFRYALGMAEAASANDDGSFVAIWGQEWGLAANGHINIFEAPVLFGWDSGQYDVFTAEGDYAGLYNAVVANPPSSSPVLLSFCHPGSGNFNNLQVTPNGLTSVHLMALVNGPANSTSTTESDVGNTNFDGMFQNALRSGYRVSPTADQDNHEATWGASSESRTAVLAAGLTKSQVLGGLAAGRNYATQDHNVVVKFSADGLPMGSAFTRSTGVRIAVEVSDPDPGDAVAQIDLYRGITGSSLASIVATSVGNPTFHWRELDTFPANTEAHYYLVIRMADNQRIWTGPVYVTYDPASQVSVDDSPRAASTLVASPYPAFGRVTASFTLPRAQHRAELIVFDAQGRRVATLLDGPMEAGSHQIAWAGHGDDGKPVAAGLFFLQLRTSEQTVSKKVMFLR